MKITKTKTALVAILALAGTAANASAARGEAQRHADNAARVLKLNGYMRPKIEAILTDLEAKGYKPVIDPAVWRTSAGQAAKVAQGYSTVSYSFHNATTKAGKPDSLAADINDIRWGDTDSAPHAFYLNLAGAAESHGLTTGIYWGLSQARRKDIHTAIAHRYFQYAGPLGWDKAHCEPTGITLYQAHRGLRPYSVKGKEVIH